MSRTFHHGERHIRARGIRQDPPDLRRLARALIALAQAQAEAEAEAEAQTASEGSGPGSAPATKSATSRGGAARGKGQKGTS